MVMARVSVVPWGDIKEGSCHLSAACTPVRDLWEGYSLLFDTIPLGEGRRFGRTCWRLAEIVSFCSRKWLIMRLCETSCHKAPPLIRDFHLSLQLIFYILEITRKVILLWRYVYILYYAYMVLTKIYICLKWIRKADTFFFLKRLILFSFACVSATFRFSLRPLFFCPWQVAIPFKMFHEWLFPSWASLFCI